MGKSASFLAAVAAADVHTIVLVAPKTVADDTWCGANGEIKEAEGGRYILESPSAATPPLAALPTKIAPNTTIELQDAAGVKHNWRKELGDSILSLQGENGSWVNTEKRWMEADPNLATAYALLTLGLFLIVINALILLLVAWLVPGFHVAGFWPAAGVGLFISVFSLLLNLVFHRNRAGR